MNQKRFYYSRSTVYGWCVYDRQTNTPAYEACCDYLPPVSDNEEGRVCVSPICETEFLAMRLCTKLNVAYKRSMRGDQR